MHTTQKSMIALVTSAMAGVALAAAGDNVTWIATNTTQKTASWKTAANWVDESGQPLAAAPTNGENVVIANVPAYPPHNDYGSGSKDMFDENMLGYQTITYERKDDKTKKPFAVGTISGDVHHTLNFGQDGSSSSSTWGYPTLTMTVTDPSNFLGFWMIGDMQTPLTVPASASLTPVFHNFGSKHRPVLTVADAEGKAVIETVYDGGALDKKGAGTLEVKATSGALSVMHVKAGKLILDGTKDGALAALLAKAALHLDASDDASLVKETGADGLVSVTRWNDVRGGSGRYCAKESGFVSQYDHQIPNSQPPFLSDEAKSPTGLTLVDFGARSVKDLAEYPERGRTNCLLAIGLNDDKARVTGVREAFYAASSPKGNGSTQILGDESSIHFMSTGADTYLFNYNYADAAVRYGDIIFNRARRSFSGYSASEFTNLYTVGVGIGRDASVGLLGTRQYYKNCTGGCRMGEILLFTNDLTRAERLLVARYLDAKWRTGDDSCDVTAVRLANDTTTIEVPEGYTARVGTVELVSGKTLTKTGGGKLVIGKLSPAGSKVVVKGGSVSFTDIGVTDTAVAANPYLHLDAATISDEDVTVDGGVTNVLQWRDITYGADRKATTAQDVTGAKMPTLITSSIAGRKVIDFGEYQNNGGSASTAAWMKLPNWTGNGNSSYSGFAVVRPRKNACVQAVFGSSEGMSFHRTSSTSLISPSYPNYVGGGAYWRVNGVVQDPLDSEALYYNTGFKVLSFSSNYPFLCNALVADKGGQGTVCCSGGWEVGEVVLYTRQLSEREILSTEAYLMKKWLGTSPVEDVSVPEIVVDEDSPVTIASDNDIAVSLVTGGNGEYVKDGAGTATVSAFNDTNATPTTLNVKQGALTLSMTRVLPFFDEALFHIDASRLDTMTYTVDDEGATNVSVIADIRRNGFQATATTDALATALPKLVKVEATPDSGIFIPALDFGGYSWKTNDYTFLSETPSACMKFSDGQVTKQGITVFADAHGAHQQSVLSSYVLKNSGHEFQRRWDNGAIYWSADTYKGVDCQGLKASSVIRNATAGTRLDGNSIDVNTKVTSDRFHIYDFIGSQSRTKVTHDWTETLTAIAMCYGKYAAKQGTSWGYDYPIEWEDRGGQYVSEQMGFSRMLTVDEQTFMLKYLREKWFGQVSADRLTNEFDSVTVAADAQLTLNLPASVTGTTCAKTASMSGDGTFAVSDCLLTDELNVTLANGKADHLTVNGTVTLDGQLAVNVTVDKSAGKLMGGKYPILTATNLVGAEDTLFTVTDLTEQSGIYTAKVVREGNTLYLEVSKRGFLIMLR